MSDFGSGDKYGFDGHENEDWFEVHSGAVTNTNPGSMVHVVINNTPICPNMSNREFREKILALRDDAVRITQQRLTELTAWSPSAQERVKIWFGSASESIRQTLISRLPALIRVMNNLSGDNFIRPDPARDIAVGCTPRTRSDAEIAHVCGPDTATHTIAIARDFCDLPQRSAGKLSSMQLTIVHECTHFADTFGTIDYPNGYGRSACALLAAGRYAEMAITNADSIAWYILAREE